MNSCPWTGPYISVQGFRNKDKMIALDLCGPLAFHDQHLARQILRFHIFKARAQVKMYVCALGCHIVLDPICKQYNPIPQR